MTIFLVLLGLLVAGITGTYVGIKLSPNDKPAKLQDVDAPLQEAQHALDNATPDFADYLNSRSSSQHK